VDSSVLSIEPNHLFLHELPLRRPLVQSDPSCGRGFHLHRARQICSLTSQSTRRCLS
jgi:hypothetical protein